MKAIVNLMDCMGRDEATRDKRRARCLYMRSKQTNQIARVDLIHHRLIRYSSAAA